MGKKQRKNKEEIHVLYALVDRTGNYSKLAGTSICSMWENTKEQVTVHLFHDGSIKDDNEQKFYSLANQYNQKLILYNVHTLLPQVWQEAKEIFAEALNSAQYSEATMYRLVAAQILSQKIKKLIYIDADTIVNIDIKKLWSEPVGKNGFAAVRENTLLNHYGLRGVGKSAEKMYNRMQDRVSLETCFNAGVLLMDMDKMRSRGNILLDGLRILAPYPDENRFYDQNILNYYFAKDMYPLPWYYNILQSWDRKHAEPACIEGIYHYMGKTLGMNGFDIRDTLYYEYFFKTPWFNGEFYCRTFKVMNEVYLQMIGPKIRDMRLLLSKLAVRCPVIAATKECEQMAKKLFAAPNEFDEPVKKKLDSNESNDEDIEINNMKEEAHEAEKKYELPLGTVFCSLGEEESIKLNLEYDVDKHFYLIFAQNYELVRKMLISVGLKEKEHFMSGAFLQVGKPWLENIIIPNKFFEML